MSKFQNRFCARSAQPRKKCKSAWLFNTKMPAALRAGNCFLARETDTMLWYMLEEGELDPNGKLF